MGVYLIKFFLDNFLQWEQGALSPCVQPYHVENTSSRLITEVKQHWAMLVLGWVTAWEYTVSYTFSHFNQLSWKMAPLSLFGHFW